MPLLKTENLSSLSNDTSIDISSDSYLDIHSLGNSIVDLQNKTGEIPWHKNGKTDPWDLVESAMGLNIAGLHKEAILAFEWMRQNQNPDGSWYSSYMNGKPLDKTRESNMSSYIATGLFHLWLITKNTQFLKSMWQSLQKGIDFALSLQTKRGEIYWAKSPQGKIDPMALLTGSSSIFMSLKCAISIGLIIGKEKEVGQWKIAFEKLKNSLQKQIHVYNISKSRYSMYWFYPVLA
ncbi:MAG: phenyltransferase domain-containing protein, partial [Desulfobacteraceae bacterium]|nr:phenyltransferase domain-containing protein [Desulfobacteraceae bacterium]